MGNGREIPFPVTTILKRNNKMKKVSILFTLAFYSLMHSQEASTENKTFFGLQAGLFGANIYTESNVSQTFVIRGEIDFAPGIWGGDLYDQTGFAVVPEIKIIPKWYYNMGKRISSSKNVKNNSANYLSAKIGFVPDWFVISNVDRISVNPMISAVPTWGIRRNFANHFNYEFQLGLGIGKILKAGYSFQGVPNLSLRVGYDF